jgi:autotransporter adhesin
MNTIYRIVWNAATGKWVVASELAKGRKKKSASKIAVLALALAGLGAPVAFAAETDSQEKTEEVDEDKSATITPFYAIGGGDDGGRADNVAIGSGAATKSSSSVAIGHDAVANNVANVAIGWGANTTGSNAISMGYNATANGNYALSLGGGSSATSERATAVGTDAQATGGTGATALGNAAKALRSYTTALGYNTSALTNSSVALGVNATAGLVDADGNAVGANQVALGMNTQALADRSVALGAGATVDAAATYGIAMGRSASVSATGVNSVALGQASVADRADTVSVGAANAERQIVNVRAGTADTDAVNVSQLKNTAESIADIIGGGSTVGSDGTISTPSYSVGGTTVHNVGDAISNIDGRVTKNAGDIVNVQNNLTAATRYFKANGKNDSSDDASATGANAAAVGPSASAKGSGAVAMGSGAAANYNNAIAIGNGASVAATSGGFDGRNSLAIGGNAAAAGQNAVVLGFGASANSFNASGTSGSTAIGTSATANAWNATALGYSAVASSDVTTALGRSSVASGSRSTAIGGNSSATGSYSVALGNGSTATRANSVSVGSATLQRQITFVDKGTQSTDAVNVEQLAPVVAGLGGGASIDPNKGTVTGPTYLVAGGTQNNVGDALTALDDVKVAYDQNADGTPNYNSVTMAGTLSSDGGVTGGTRITNVAQGVLNDTSTEAVNGSQLFATNERVTKNEGDIVTIGDRVTNAETNITNLDGRVTTNEGDIIDIRNQLGNGSIGLVQQDENTRDITVAAGTDGGKVNFAGTDGARKLAGVSEGELSKDSTEAVNGSQLFAMNERVTKNEGDIVTIGDRVTSAETNITNLDGRVTKNEGDIIDLGDRINNGSVGLVQQAGASAAVTVAAATGGTIVDFSGTDGARQLKGVSEGSDGSDAVNVTQLRNEIAKASAGDTRYFKADGANDGSDDAINAGSRSVAIGAGSHATADNAVALGAGSVADRANAVSVGSAGNERQIVNVADGTEDTDAVNVRQLKSAGLVGDDGSLMDAVVYDAGSNRGSITLGGVAGTAITNVMAGLVAPGSMDAINGSQLWGVQDQINKLGDRVTTIENGGAAGPSPIVPITPVEGNPHFASSGDAGKPATATGSSSVAAGEGAVAGGNNSTAIGAGSSATGNNSVAIGAGSVADGDNMVSVGSVGNERRIANVAAGTQRTDAANVGQLQDAMSNLQDWTQGQVNGLSKKVDNVQRQANRGIAASAALVNNMPYLPGKVTLNAGVAAYRGQSALGVGISRWNDSGRFNVNAGVSAAQGDAPIFRLGVGVVLGD